MKKKGYTRIHSAADLKAMRARGEDRSDFTAVLAKSEAELAQDVAGDPEWQSIPSDWYLAAEAVMPVPKKLLSLRLDNDIIDWFRSKGPGYQTRINAVLRSFIEQEAKHPR